MNTKHIFLSYRSTEVDFALKLAADLKNGGVNLWMDRLDIRPGDDWVNALQNAVNECEAIIAILSPDYIKSRYCRRELARADRMSRPVFPVLLRPISPQDWPFELERRQYIDFNEWQDEKIYQENLQALIETLREHVAEQINPIPDLETRYLTSLIADLEAFRGVLEYVELSTMANTPAVEKTIRPRPRFEAISGASNAYTLLTDAQNAPPDELNLLHQHKTPLDSIVQAVRKYPCFVLIGAAGAGKTTTIHRLALQLARERQSKSDTTPMPLLLNLPAWRDGMDLVEFIRSQWPFEDDPIPLLQQGRIILFLDGLNEMGASGPYKAKELRAWLQGDNAPQRAIITCRSTDYTGDLNLHLPTVMVEALDESRIRRFVINYLGKEASDPLLARLLPEDAEDRSDSRHLFQLAQNPFLLTILILVYSDSPDGDLPRNMGSLVKRLVMALWERDRMRLTPGWVPFEQMEASLGSLACAILDGDMPNYVSQEYALQHLGGESLLRAGNSVNILQIHGDNVHFYHQLILEYLAAVGLSQVGLPSKLMRPAFDHRGNRVSTKWDQVIIALSGITTHPDLVVGEVSEVDPYLALECVASGIKISPTTYEQAVARLQKYIAAADIDGRIAAARLLGSLGHEGAVSILMDAMSHGTWEVRQAAAWALRDVYISPLPGLLEALHDWDQDDSDVTATAVRQIGSNAVPMLLSILHGEHWSMRRGAAWALGEIGDKAAVPGLVQALQDEDGLVRREAALALGWLRDEAAVPFLLAAIQDKDWRVRQACAETLGWIGSPSLTGLLNALKDSSTNVRRVAAEALGRIGDASAIPGLLDALQDESVDVRGAALQALGWLKSSEVVPTLLQCLSDTTSLRWDEKRICDIAADSLTNFDTPEVQARLQEWRQGLGAVATEINQGEVRTGADMDSTLPKLLDDLKNEDSLVRWSAVKGLAAFQSPEAIQGVLGALKDDDVLVCDAAAEALARIGPVVVPDLLDILQDANANVRGAVVEALGKIKDPAAVSSLIESLTDTEKPWLSDERICDLAVRALEHIATDDALEAARNWRRIYTPLSVSGSPEQYGPFHQSTLTELLEFLHDEDLAVQQDAATALREQAKSLKGTDHPSVLQMLTDALKDDNWFVRWAVVEALAWIGDPAAVPALLEILRDSNWTVRMATVRALAEIGDSRAVPNLITVLRDKHPMVREATAEVLGMLGNVSANDSLISALHDPEAFVRRAAAEALGIIGDPVAVSDLLETLDDESNDVRWVVAEALGKIGDANAVSGLIQRLDDTYEPDWEEQRLCDVVATALQHIGTTEALQAVEQWRQNQIARD